MKLSIVVPTYNVEKYIARCLNSLYDQDVSHDTYEIIIINDGSTDHSLEVVEQLTNSWTNVKIVTQANAGLSEARNKGLQLAEGEYIWFVDSDDWIEAHSLSTLMENLEELDILMIEHNLANDQTQTPNVIRYEVPNRIYTGMQILEQRNPQNCVPFYIYRRSLITKNQLCFKKGIYYEDSLFTPMVLCYAQNIRFMPEPVYNYYQRPGSITNSKKTSKHCLDCIIIANELINFIQNQKTLQAKEQYLLNNRIASVMGSFVLNWMKLDKKDQAQVLQVWKQNKHIISHVQKSNRYKTTILLFLMTWISPFYACR